jgi:hypothetical protein
MTDILLSMPEFYLYLVFVMVLLMTALWARETGPPVGEPRATAPTTGRAVGDAPAAARCNLDRAPLRSSALPPQRDRRPFRDLEAALSANYAARLEQAVRTIRGSPPAGARPTDQAVWVSGKPRTRPVRFD